MRWLPRGIVGHKGYCTLIVKFVVIFKHYCQHVVYGGGGISSVVIFVHHKGIQYSVDLMLFRMAVVLVVIFVREYHFAL